MQSKLAQSPATAGTRAIPESSLHLYATDIAGSTAAICPMVDAGYKSEEEAQMIDIHFGMPDECRKPAIALYYEAFERKFCRLMSLEEALTILPNLLNSEQAIIAIRDGKLVGFAGIQHGNKPLFAIRLQPFIECLGIFRGAFVFFVLMLSRRPYKDGELLMDGICVDKNLRGQGIGSLLLEAIFDFAKQNNYKTIRLDVVDTNPSARKLYERMGFEPISSYHYPFTKRLMGFSAATTMIKKVV
ncbi:MAG: GNAT family N-acetyltransferase [Chloroflexus sp.]|nr:GNAT family N-acetyltransferase [Chloroflexus sp.]